MYNRPIVKATVAYPSLSTLSAEDKSGELTNKTVAASFTVGSDANAKENIPMGIPAVAQKSAKMDDDHSSDDHDFYVEFGETVHGKHPKVHGFPHHGENVHDNHRTGHGFPHHGGQFPGGFPHHHGMMMTPPFFGPGGFAHHGQHHHFHPHRHHGHGPRHGGFGGPWNPFMGFGWGNHPHDHHGPQPDDGSCMKRNGRMMARVVKGAFEKAEEENVFAPGQSFAKTWRIRNDSNTPWPEDVELQFIGGDAEVLTQAPIAGTEMMGAVTSYNVPGGLAPGNVMDVTLPLRAPSVPGKYEVYFRFREFSFADEGKTSRVEGAKFGQRFGCNIIVDASSDSSSSSSESSSDEGEGGESKLQRSDDFKPNSRENRKGARAERKKAKKLEKLRNRATRLQEKLAKIEAKMGKISKD